MFDHFKRHLFHVIFCDPLAGYCQCSGNRFFAGTLWLPNVGSKEFVRKPPEMTCLSMTTTTLGCTASLFYSHHLAPLVLSMGPFEILFFFGDGMHFRYKSILHLPPCHWARLQASRLTCQIGQPIADAFPLQDVGPLDASFQKRSSLETARL